MIVVSWGALALKGSQCMLVNGLIEAYSYSSSSYTACLLLMRRRRLFPSSFSANIDVKSIVKVFESRSPFMPQKLRSKASGHQKVSCSMCESIEVLRRSDVLFSSFK